MTDNLGDINDPKYYQGLMSIKSTSTIKKMTVLCNTQDGHFDIDLKEVSSLKGQLVEAGGVEPPSENTSSGTSPGADGYLHSRAMTQAVMLHGLVASLCMLEAKITPVTCTT